MSVVAARPVRATKSPPRAATTERESVNVFGPKARPLWAAGGLLAASAAMDDLPGWPGVLGMAGAAALAWPAVKLAVKLAAKFRPDAASRRVAALTACSASWLSGASVVDWSVEGTATWIALGSLAAGAAAFGYGPRHWFTGAPAAAPVSVEAVPVDERTDEQKRVDAILEIWNTRVNTAGALKGVVIKPGDIKPVAGGLGWKARFELPAEAAETESVEKAAGRVARAYRTGRYAVGITVDPNDESMATVMVLTENPLEEVQWWDGSGINPDGTAKIGRYLSAPTMLYRYYSKTGTWHDLFAGTTGSGKSELTNLLLCMEIRSGDTVSYLIDPQQGQSYGELVKLLSGTAYAMESTPEAMGIRELLARIEAEMYRRNAALTAMKWTDADKEERTGVKTWRPGLEGMPLLVVTIDEAHAVLSDQVCCAIITRLCAMARKCGIKIRLITQVPLLASLRRMEIRDAVAGGNVVVFRTANALSGAVAANGRLPGPPNRLPIEWEVGRDAEGEPIMEPAAGLCYSVGSVSVPEVGRTICVGDPFRFLFGRGGVPLHRSVQIELPKPHVPVTAPAVTDGSTASGGGDDEGTAGAECKDAVLDLFTSRPGQVITRKEVLAAVGASWAVRTVAWALKGLSEASEIDKLGDGQYRLAERP